MGRDEEKGHIPRSDFQCSPWYLWYQMLYSLAPSGRSDTCTHRGADETLVSPNNPARIVPVHAFFSLYKSNSTLESQSQNHSQKHRMLSPKTLAYGVFDCNFGFDSQVLRPVVLPPERFSIHFLTVKTYR